MEDIVSITRVFKIINSCTNLDQLKTCENLAEAYTKMAKGKGVINFKDVHRALEIKINEKREELEYIEIYA